MLLKEIDVKFHVKNQPKPMNTVELLKASSSKLKIGPSETMRLSQNLYQRGYISYPRTETTAFGRSFSLYNALIKAVSDKQLNRWSQGLISIEVCSFKVF